MADWSSCHWVLKGRSLCIVTERKEHNFTKIFSHWNAHLTCKVTKPFKIKQQAKISYNQKLNHAYVHKINIHFKHQQCPITLNGLVK